MILRISETVTREDDGAVPQCSPDCFRANETARSTSVQTLHPLAKAREKTQVF
jgi:hypothetical protein